MSEIIRNTTIAHTTHRHSIKTINAVRRIFFNASFTGYTYLYYIVLRIFTNC